MKNTLNAKAFALTCGILWSFALTVLSILAIGNGYGTLFLEMMASVYIGYSASVQGVAIGAIWGFIDGAVGGLIFAWLYNKLASKIA